MRRTGLSCPDSMVPYMQTCAPCDSGLPAQSSSPLPEWLQGDIEIPLLGSVPKVLALILAVAAVGYVVYKQK